MEELEGEPLSAYRARAETDPDAARKVADLALREILTQVFENGRFHADPHAGNLFVLPDGRLGLIDLGLTGESGTQDRRRIARAVRAFVSGDAEALTRALLDFGMPPPEFSHADFRVDILAVVRQHEAQLVAHVTGRNGVAPAAQNGLETFVNDLFRVAYRHGLYVPPSTTLLIKAIVTIEGVARSLNPNLNVVSAALPIVVRALCIPAWRQRARRIVLPPAMRAPAPHGSAHSQPRRRRDVRPNPAPDRSATRRGRLDIRARGWRAPCSSRRCEEPWQSACMLEPQETGASPPVEIRPD